MQSASTSSGEVERGKWNEYLIDFSSRNEGRPTRLEVIDPELGSQELEIHFPLIGISFEPEGSEAGSVEIILGGDSADDSRHMEHIVEDAKRIVPIPGTRDVEDGIAIESGDGSRTLLTFEELRELARE